MPYISWPKFWYPLIALGLGYAFYKDKRKAAYLLLMLLVALGISDLMTSHVLKNILGRLRPCHTLEGVHLLAGCSDSFSLPSSHASNSAAMSTVAFYEHRKLLFPLVFLILLIAYSRVYLGVHYPFDVLLGMITGIGYGFAVVGMKKGLLGLKKS